MIQWLKKISKRAKDYDLSSTAALMVGLVSISISLIIGLITWYKLVEHHTGIIPSTIISIIVFAVFTPVYSFILFAVLSYIEKKEDVL